MNFREMEGLAGQISRAVEKSAEASREADRLLEQMRPQFDAIEPNVRSVLASKIAYEYNEKIRHFIDPKAEPIQADRTSTTRKLPPAASRARSKFWKSSDDRQFAYTVGRETDEKGHERFLSFAITKVGVRTDVARHAKKKDAILRAARLMVEHEAKIAPVHAKVAFEIAVSIAKKAERPDDMWESLNAALKTAKKSK